MKSYDERIEELRIKQETMTDDEITAHHKKRMISGQKKINSQAGMKVRIVNSDNKRDYIDWVLIEKHMVQGASLMQTSRTTSKLGIKSLRLREFLWTECDLPLAHLYMHLQHKNGDPTSVLTKMNDLVFHWNQYRSRGATEPLLDYGGRARNDYVSLYDEDDDGSSDDEEGFEIVPRPVSTTRGTTRRVRKTKPFSLSEYLLFHALMIGAADTNRRGHNNWIRSTDNNSHPAWTSMVGAVDFGKYMSLTRFKEFKHFYSRAFESDELRDSSPRDPWWRVGNAIRGFNENRRELILSSVDRVLDESMSSWRPQTQRYGNLPFLSYQTRKPKNLGIELKCAGCPRTGVLTFIELVRGKHDRYKEQLQYAGELKPVPACTLRLANGSCQSYEDGEMEVVHGDAWFGNIASVRAVAGESASAGPGRECCFTMKGHSKLFPTRALHQLLQHQPGGVSAVFKGYCSVLKRNLLAIGWKFNSDKVLTFLATDGFATTEPSPEPYRMRFPDEHGNMQFRDVPRPLLVHKHFEVLNCIDIHNHLRQENLALEENWITRNGNFRVLTSIIGFNVTDTYQLSKFHDLLGPLKYAGPHNEPIPIRNFAGVLAHQLIRLSQKNDLQPFSIPLLQTGTDPVYINNDEDNDNEDVIEVNIVKEKNEVVGHMEDRMGNWHTMMKVKKSKTKVGKTFRTPTLCGYCSKNHSIVFCKECNMVMCYPLRCTVVTGDSEKDKKMKTREQKRSCFYRHVQDVTRDGNRKRKKGGFVDLTPV